MIKEIKFDRLTRDYEAKLDGETIGYFKSQHAAENELNRLRYEQLKHEAYVAKLEALKGAA